MSDDIILSIIKTLESVLSNVRITNRKGDVFLESDCPYCGRSKSGHPHFSVLIQQTDSGKITGCVGCFRCGETKSLTRFLLEYKNVFSTIGLTKTVINENIETVPGNKARENGFLSAVRYSNQRFIDRQLFYKKLFQKENAVQIAQNKLLAFKYVKDRLKIQSELTVFDAYSMLHRLHVNTKSYSDGMVMRFQNHIDYVFEYGNNPKYIQLKEPMDIKLFGKDTISYNISSYRKHFYGEKREPYILGQDMEMKPVVLSEISNKYDTLNIYIAEGVFDTLTMYFHNHYMNIHFENMKKYAQFFVATGSNKLETVVTNSIYALMNIDNPGSLGIPKQLNVVFVPDRNMNWKRYLLRLNKFFRKSDIVSLLRSLSLQSLKIYYIDIYSLDGSPSDINEYLMQNPLTKLNAVDAIRVA
jgi:hypothetical protein